MAKLNRFKAFIFQDLTQLIPKKQFQNETIACFHNTTPTWRFWSFLEFSKRDGQYLNRTKENETYEDSVNLPETLLAFPTRTQMFQSAFSKNQTDKDSSLANIKLKNLKTKTLTELENQLKGDAEVSDNGPIFKSIYKLTPSKSLPRISLNRQKEKTSSTFALPMEATRLKRSKSFSNPIVSRYSSGIAKSRRDIGLSMSKPGLSKPSIQIANMSSGSGKRNNRNRKNSKTNRNESQECSPPCPPPPPPPPCCPPPPPPCCPEPPSPPKKKKSKSRKSSNNECQPPPEPPCIEACPEMEESISQKKCEGWCPVLDKGSCYKSKCPEKKKKKPCPPIKPCPPKCFEPDPCEKPKAFCVGCPPNKKKNRDFSTYTSIDSVRPFASRSFTTDRCENKCQKEEIVEERFNKRFLKPGPACKDDTKCELAASIKPANDKCFNKKSITDIEKSLQKKNAVFLFAKNDNEMIEEIMRKEFEAVKKCKKGNNNSKTKKSSQCKNEKIEKPSQDAKCRIIDTPCKTIFTSFLNKQRNKSKTSEKINNHLSVVANKIVTDDSNNVKKPINDLTEIKEMEPRNWFTSWLS